jgi:hypothetical protein
MSEGSPFTAVKTIKMMIASAFYEVKAYSPYIVSLIISIKFLDKLGIEWDYVEVSGDSYVDRAKNSLMDQFLKSDCTHLFMVDSDMSWEVVGFGRMVKDALAGFELVGAAYPCKNNWEFFGCIPVADEKTGYVMGKELGDLRVLEMWGIPGGFILYSKEAIERARPNLKTYKEYGRDGTVLKEVLECFKCNIEADGSRIGEDIYFQQRYKEAGGIVWLEPDVTIKHIGVKAWEGNYHEFLLNNRGSWEADVMTFGQNMKDSLEDYDKKCALPSSM